MYIFVDIDECTDNSDKCDQLCSNTIGSYECLCLSGYELNDNSYSCDGESCSS